MPAAGPTGFDLERRYALHPQVAVRPEPFGALLYHFGTRRLSLVKDPRLLQVVRGLADAPSAHAACTAAGVTEAELARFALALATLAETDMLEVA
jgi:putative mycofactocin binding protein MftB